MEMELRAIFFDGIYFTVGRPEINLGAAACAFNFADIINQFYRRPAWKNHRLLEDILLGKEDFFKISLSGNHQTGTTRRIQTRFLSVYNSIASVTVFMEVGTVVSQLLVSIRVCGILHQQKSNWIKLIYVLIFLLNSIVFDSMAIIYGQFIPLIMSVGSAQLSILLLKLSAIHVYLLKLHQISNYHPCYQVQQHLTHLLPYATEYNRLYGRVFVVFLLANLPVNVYFVGMITLAQLQISGIFLVGFYALLQIGGLFGIHYYFMRFAKRFHQPSRPLLSVMARKQQLMGDLRARIKLMATIAALHTTNQYGITYGTCGLVTIKKFSKVFFIP